MQGMWMAVRISHVPLSKVWRVQELRVLKGVKGRATMR